MCLIRGNSVFIILLLSIGSLLFGCKQDSPENENNISDEQIEQAYREIKVSADSILLSEKPDFYSLAAKIKQQEEVKNVEATDEGMIIEFENGEIRGWLKTIYYQGDELNNAPQKSAILKNALRSSNSISLVQNKIALVNAESNDERMAKWKTEIDDLADEFSHSSWKVDTLYGEDANLNFFGKRLSEYDVVYVNAHGGLSTILGCTWIVTGEQYVIPKFFNQLGGNKGVFTIDEKRNGNTVPIDYVAFSDNFISESYSANSFPGSMFYFGACHGLQKTEQLAAKIIGKGAKVIVGWDESDCIGPHTGVVLLEKMLYGKTNLAQAVNSLPIELISDSHPNRHPLANLVVYPVGTGGAYTLPIANGNFEIISTYQFSDGTISLERKFEDDYYTNADGAKFYKNTLAIGIAKNGQKELIPITTAGIPYSYKDNKGTNPCILIDLAQETITVFANSKAGDGSYSMTGYAYRKVKNTNWQTETAFSNVNDGFFSFFGGSNNGNPEIYHFSYAGYYAKKAVRNASGSWSNSSVGAMNPSFADRQYYAHKNILVTSNSGVDSWSFTDSGSFDNLNGYNNGNSQTAGAVKVSDILN